MAEPSLTPVASMMTTLLALNVVFAVDSVEEGDPFGYRLTVGGLGLAAIGPIAVVLLQTVVPLSDFSSIDAAGWKLLISVGLVLLLVITVAFVEVLRDFETEESQRRLAVGIGVLVFVWYAILLVFF